MLQRRSVWLLAAASAAPLLLPLAAPAATEMPALPNPRATLGTALPHDAEIKAFPSTMAIARTVRESCPGVEPNEGYLEVLRLRLQVAEADHPAFAPEAHAAAEVLKRGLVDAPSREAWCAAVLRIYGPDGYMVRGMLRRQQRTGQLAPSARRREAGSLPLPARIVVEPRQDANSSSSSTSPRRTSDARRERRQSRPGAGS